jgi:L-fucose isomerase-like protein
LRALVNLPGSRIALIGGMNSGFDNLIVDAELLKHQLGVEIVEVDIDEIIARANAANNNLVSKTIREIRSSASTFDHSQSRALEKSARVYQSVMALAEEKNLVGIAMNCRPQFQRDYGLAACTVMGHLNTNGAIAACEGDVPSAVGMMLLRWLSNGDPVTVMDLVSIDHADQSVLLWKCGATSPKMADERGMHLQSLWMSDGPHDQRIGLHNVLVMKPGLGTILGLMPDLSKMLILEGGIDPHKSSYMGSRGWLKNLHLNLEPITTTDLTQTLMSSGFQHHFPFAYGSQSAAALELCAWLGIEPIKKQAYTSYLIG